MTTSPQTLQDLASNALRTVPDTPAIRYRGDWYDWGWMRDSGASIMGLLNACATPTEKPVGLVSRNRPTSAAALLALIAAGRSIRMIHAFQSPRMMAQDVARMEIGALIASDDDFTAPVCAALRDAQLCGISLDEEAGIGLVEDGDDVAPAGGPHALPAAAPQAVIEVLTSGTTGPPKHFSIPFDKVVESLVRMNVIYSTRDTYDKNLAAMMFFPLGTISGLYSYLPLALDGRPVVLPEKFNLDEWLDWVAEYRPKRATLPTPGIHALLRRDIPREALASIRYIGTGAAPVDVDAQTEFEDRFGIPILISYGATEFGGPVAAMSPDLRTQWGTRKRGSAGQAWGGARLRIVDPATGKELPPGTDGILEVVSPMIGPDWIRTSDLAMIDEDDFLFHRGRADGAITRGGFSILPEAIETALVRHPEVAAAAVVGLPHRRLGEVPAAAIQPKNVDSPPDLGELERHVRDRIFATHVPAHFRFVSALPMTASMKVDLSKVRALFDREPGR